MKPKKLISLFLIMALTVLTMAMTVSANNSTDLGVEIQATMIDVTVTINNKIEINPNAELEADIIKISAVQFKNNTACPVVVEFETIEYIEKVGEVAFNGPDVFCSYNQNALLDGTGAVDKAINWRTLSMTNTHKYMAFGLEKIEGTGFNDLLPDRDFKVLTLSSKFDDSGNVADTATNKVNLNLDLKAGRAWGATYAGTHKYNITFIFSLAEDDFTTN